MAKQIKRIKSLPATSKSLEDIKESFESFLYNLYYYDLLPKESLSTQTTISDLEEELDLILETNTPTETKLKKLIIKLETIDDLGSFLEKVTQF